jgi:hypothetical protein
VKIHRSSRSKKGQTQKLRLARRLAARGAKSLEKTDEVHWVSPEGREKERVTAALRPFALEGGSGSDKSKLQGHNGHNPIKRHKPRAVNRFGTVIELPIARAQAPLFQEKTRC